MNWNNIKKSLALIFVSSVITVSLVEIGLRLFVDNIPHWRPIDNELGWKLGADIKGWQVQEGRVWIETNSHGFNSPETPIQKPDDVFRIAVLGDSFMEALQVPLEESFTMLLDQKFKEKSIVPGKTIEVMNFGVGGYNTAQEYLMLKNTVADFSPDLVVLAVFFGNDITDNHPEMCEGCDRPFFIEEQGQVTLDTSFRTTSFFEFKLSPTGRVLNWARNSIRILQQVDQVRRILVASQADGARLMRETGEIYEIYKQNAEPRFEQAWKNTEGALAAISEFSQDQELPLLVVTLPLQEQVTIDEAVYEEALRFSELDNLFYPERRISEMGQRLGFDVFSLGPLMQEIARQRDVWLLGTGEFLGQGHWNESGHQVAADLTEPVLEAFIAKQQLR